MGVTLRILSYLRKYWKATAVAYVCLTLAALIDVYVPQLIRGVIDCGMRIGVSPEMAARCPPGQQPMEIVGHAALLIMGLTVLKGAFQFGQGYLGEYGAQGIAYDIRNGIYQHLQRLSFSWHDRAQTGQLMARATSDVEQLRNFTGRGFLQLANFVVLTVAITVVLFTTSWQLAVVSLLTAPLLLRVVIRYQKVVRPLFNQIQQELAVLASIIQENLAGVKVVKAFAREPDEVRKFEQQNSLLLGKYVDAARVQSFANPLMDMIVNLGTVIVLLFGGYQVMTGYLTVGELVAFNTYLLLIIRPVRRLGFLISQSSRAIAAGERVFEILDAPVDVADKPDAIPLPSIQGEVRFENVTVSYYGGQPVLKNVTFAAQPGQVVALLGATGSGKSTIVNLIPRFYDVSEGQVLIDGHDVRDAQILSLRRQIGMVLQDTTLFTGNIRDNIAFGAPGATEEHIVAMAQAARAHDFIMPSRMDTTQG